jgi:hypothetical protein
VVAQRSGGPIQPQSDPPATTGARKAYRKPRLERFGDLRGLTLQSKRPGTGDSGSPLTRKTPTSL